MRLRDDESQGSRHEDDPWLRLLSLLSGLLMASLLVFFPSIAQDRWGGPDPVAALLLVWAMAAGLVSGVGITLRNVFVELLLCPHACLLALVLSCVKIAGH